MKKKLAFIVIIAILVASIFVIKHNKYNSSKAKASDNYVLLNRSDVTIVKAGLVNEIITFTGDLSALNQTVISSEVDAIAKKILVEEGDYVKVNQVLAVLDNTELSQAVSQQEALLSSARAKFELDKKKLEKQKDLYNQGFISKIAYEELQTNYQSSREVINQQQALLVRAKKQLSDTVIRAPFNGYVYQRNIDSGQLAVKNAKLFSLASLDNLQIKAAIPSEEINKISIGQDVLFNIETNSSQYSGQVMRINPVAETGTRSYYIYIDFDNRKYKLKAGQFVKGQIVLNSMSSTYISHDAIRMAGDSSYVYILENGVVYRKSVKVLLTNRLNNISAVSGLKVGDVVLLANVLSIRANDHAKVVD